MTVAAGIAIGTAVPQAIEARGLAGARPVVAGQTAAGAHSADTAESFRSKWQALMQAHIAEGNPMQPASDANYGGSSSAIPETAKTVANAPGTLKTTQVAAVARQLKQNGSRTSVVAESLAATARNELQPIADQGAKSTTAELSATSDRRVAKTVKLDSAAASVPATGSMLEGVLSQAVTAPIPLATQAQPTSQALLGGGATEANASGSMLVGPSSPTFSSETKKEWGAAGIQPTDQATSSEGPSSNVALGEKFAPNTKENRTDGIDQPGANGAQTLAAAEREAGGAQTVEEVSLQSLGGAGNANEASAASSVKDASVAVQTASGTNISSADAAAAANPSAGSSAANDTKAPAAAAISRNRRGTEAIQDHSAGRAEHTAGGSFHGDPVSIRLADPVAQTGVNPALTRDEAGAAIAGISQVSLSHGRTLDAPGFGNQDTFAALDAASASPATTWTHAALHRAEAGYLDPALGWVSVRAEGSGGGVHAAVVPGSTEAALILGGQLPELNVYLAQHHGQAATVTLAAPENGNGGSGSGQGSNYGSNQQQSADQRDNYKAEPAQSQSATTSNRHVSGNLETAGLIDGMISRTGGNRGAHISVVA